MSEIIGAPENRPIIQMDLEGNFIKEFPSVKAAGVALGNAQKYSSNIYYACSILKRYIPKVIRSTRSAKVKPVKSNIAYGYRWKFKETI